MITEKEECFMTVKEVVEAAGVSKRTLQYYDSIGLLPADKRTQAGYRLFSEKAVDTLKTIGYYKSMGFELKEIREILYTDGYDVVAALKRRREQLEKEYASAKEKLELVERALKELLDNDVT